MLAVKTKALLLLGGFLALAAPAPAPAPAPAGGNPSHVLPRTTMDAPNVARLQELKARNPKACGYQEVAPSVWIRIDCHTYVPSTKAIAHVSPRKAKLIAQHKTLWKPIKQLPYRRGGASLSRGGGPAAPAAGGERAAIPGTAGAGNSVKADAVPGAVDHREGRLEGPVKDQGAVGSCTAFSLSATIDNQAIRAGKMTSGNRDQAASPNHVWSGYGIPQMGTAADANLGRTIATFAVWDQNNKEACKLASPMYEECNEAYPGNNPGTWRQDPVIVAKYDKANAGGAYKVAGFEKLDTLPVSTDELVQTLASGSDLWIAMKIDGYAWSNSKMKNGVIPDWTDPNGGHAITMSGYRDMPTGRQYLIHNSWGTSWGDQGYAWVSEAMVQKYMHYAYRVKLSDGTKGDDITDDDCAPDELVDILSGICGLICADDTRPNGGCPQIGGGLKR